MTLDIHHVPGRLRFRAPTFGIDPAAACRDIRAIAGVTSVEHNACTGSITVQYDVRRLPPARLLAMLGNAGCMPRSAQARAGSSAGIEAMVQRLVELAAEHVVETLARRGALTVLACLL